MDQTWSIKTYYRSGLGSGLGSGSELNLGPELGLRLGGSGSD